MRDRRPVFGVALVLLATAPPAFAQDKPPDKAQLAAQAKRVLETSCHRCHKGEGSESGWDFESPHRPPVGGNPQGGQNAAPPPGPPGQNPISGPAPGVRSPPAARPSGRGIGPNTRKSSASGSRPGRPTSPRRKPGR